ncbi:hypothetical protein HY414_00910 [Candidatus Kaiserbacteria bacterium]|nr:hypothetical protein [Candidatus Kaiserbacteria bacterium]
MADASQSASRAPFTPEEPKASLASNILAIVGFIILIVVVIWGLVNLASLSRGWFSSLFGKSAAIEVIAPENVVSGTPFAVSWEYDEPAAGTYAFLYQCENGLGFQTPGPAGVVGVPCGAAFTIASMEKKVSLIPYLSGNEARDVPLSIIFMPSATGTRAEGSATVRVSPILSTTPAPTPTPTPEPTPAPTPTPEPAPAPAPAAASSAPADLSVRIISVSVDAGGNGVATFDIANIGGSMSGTYYFSATLPTQSGYVYTSPAQAPLAPQAHIVSTLRFSQGVSSIFSVSITTPDSNSGNNYASQTVSTSYMNYSPYAPGYSGTQYDSYDYSYNTPYNSQYMYPYQYQTYPQPNVYMYPEPYGTSYQNQYPSYSQQNPSPYAQGYGGTQYSTYYPYTY